MIKSLWNDEAGVVLSAELVLIMTIVVIGMVVGLAQLQAATLGELGDVARSTADLDQSYSTPGYKTVNGNHVISYSAGASYTDTADTCDCCDVVLLCDCNAKGEK